MIQIEFDAIIFQEGKGYVAHCPKLDVSSCGHDVDEARRNLKTAVRLFVEEAEKLGTLDDILREAGYQKSESAWKSPRIMATEIMSLAAGLSREAYFSLLDQV
jgi:predicted RNase H-like HicB family nuclease